MKDNQDYDVETELHYCQTRYYDPRLYQWLSVDSLEYLDIEGLLGLNLYCYCLNNPVMYNDDDGTTLKRISILGLTIANFLSFAGSCLQ